MDDAPQVEGESLPADASQEVENDWEDSQEVFEEPIEETGEQPEIEGKEDSHLEADVPEYLKLDELKAPKKYKGDVKKWIQERVIPALKKEHEEASRVSGEQLGQYKQVAGGLMDVLLDITNNPERGAYYIEKYGDQLGIDKAKAKAFLREQAREEAEIQAPLQSIEDIASKYVSAMINESDPRIFMSYQVQMMNEALGATQKAVLQQVGQVLKRYHDTYVAPDKESLSEFRERAKVEQETAAISTSGNNWNQALSKLEEKYPGIKKHSKDLSKMMKEQKTFKSALDALNEDPGDIDGRMELVESAWLRLSRRLESQKKPKPSGLPPTKHLQTNKIGGSGWDEIEAEFWS
jgi:hypothetical protein